MKTASIPAVRVEPALRAAAEEVLDAGEALSSFVAESIRRNIELRKHQRAFLARGIAAGERARRTGKYVEPSSVLRKLDRRLAEARRRARLARR